MRKYTLSEQLLDARHLSTLWGAREPVGQPSPLQGRGSCGGEAARFGFMGRFSSESLHPQLDFQTGHLEPSAEAETYEGFISRQREDKGNLARQI